MSISTWSCVCPGCGLNNIVKKVGSGPALTQPPRDTTCYGKDCNLPIVSWVPLQDPVPVPVPLTPLNIDETLDQRGRRYGSWSDNSSYAQDFLSVIDRAIQERSSRLQLPLAPHQENSLLMICQKMSRILSGDATYEDNWVDIEGYARLGRNPR